MEVEYIGFIQEAFKGFLKCLGLEAVHNSPPTQPPLDPEDSTTYEPLPTADDSATTDPLVDSLSSQGHIPVPATMGRGKIAEANYVELIDGGKTNMSLLATRLISSGGGGKTH